jgi:hypothetical protein
VHFALTLPVPATIQAPCYKLCLACCNHATAPAQSPMAASISLLALCYLPNRAGLIHGAEVETLGLDISYHGGSSYPHDRAHSSGWEAPKGGQVRGHFLPAGIFATSGGERGLASAAP